MIERRIRSDIERSLRTLPVVGIIGARQVGRTTLAKSMAADMSRAVVYLDLEKPSDLAKLTEPELYLEMHAGALVVLDEVQRKPDLFPILRSLVDAGTRNGRFLILGSASPDLMRQSSESLAGRIVYHELSPFSLAELTPDTDTARDLWRRGGYPRSFLASSDRESMEWRGAFIRTHLERDIPNLGVRVAPAALRRFWLMLAHSHGQLWNASKIAGSLGVSHHTVNHYLDILEDTFMLRRLPPFHANLRKRLVKRPKVYLRDSGLLHALLGLEKQDDLLAHPVVGASWEGWVVEQILGLVPWTWNASFFRTVAGAETDLILQRPAGRRPLAVDIRHTARPQPGRGYWSAMEDTNAERGYIVYPGEEYYPLGKGVFALPVGQLALLLEEEDGEFAKRGAP